MNNKRLNRQITRGLRRTFSQRADSYQVQASTGETLIVSVRDRSLEADPVSIARKEMPCYSSIVALAVDLQDPYVVAWFKEVETGRLHNVLRYQPNAGNNATYTWSCESERTSHVTAPPS